MPTSIPSRAVRLALIGPSAVAVLVVALATAPVTIAGQPGDITIASVPDQRTLKLGDLAADDNLVAVAFQERNVSYVRWSNNYGSSFAPRAALRNGLRAKEPRVAVCDSSIFAVSIWRSDAGDNVGVDFRNLSTGDTGRFSLGAGGEADIACYGEIIAVTWVHDNHLWVAMHEGPCASQCVPRVKLDLGTGDFDSPPRISDDYGEFVVTWISEGLAVQHFAYESGAGSFTIHPGPVLTLMAGKDVRKPEIAETGGRTVVAYARNGQTHMRISDDDSTTYGPRIIVSKFCRNCPNGSSEPESIDIAGPDILVEVMSGGGTPRGYTVIAYLSRDSGDTWLRKPPSNDGGFRRGVLLRDGDSTYAETWDFHFYNGPPYPAKDQLIGFHVRSRS